MVVERMFDKVLTWMILLHLIGHFVSTGEALDPDFGVVYGWNQAMQFCESKGVSLPNILIKGKGFALVDENLENSKQCFWLRATYEHAENLTDESYPMNCCEMLYKYEDNSHTKDCIQCEVQNSFFCESDNKTIHSLHIEYGTWLQAGRYCRDYAQRLPSDSNEIFIQNLPQQKPFWVNGVRRLNLQPSYSDGLYDFCFCNGRVHPICPLKPKTLCAHVTTYHTNSETAMPTHSLLNVSFTLKIPRGTSATSGNSSSDKGAVIGGVAGSVVVTVTIVVVIIILVMKHRTRKDGSTHITTNCKEQDRESPSDVTSYNADLGNIYIHEEKTETTTQAQDSKQSSTVYAQPMKYKGKNNQSCEKGKIVESTDDRINDGLYSIVQKRLNTDNAPTCGKMIKETGGQEYDTLSCSNKSIHSESSRNVYDKTNFHCHVDSEYDTTYGIKISIDTTYDHAK